MLDFTITAFVSILFLVDPPGTIPLFLALTSSYPPRKRRRTALVACIAATIVMCIFAVLGTYLFHYLGLSLPAFQIAGGLILFLVALDMIRDQHSPTSPAEESEASNDAGDVAITPLAVPLLAGPAALSTVAVLMSRATDPGKVVGVFLAIAGTGLCSYLTLRLADPIQRRMGKTGIHVIGRVLGLVLAGIAVQFVLDGLAAAKIISEVR
ncbi:MAG: MarC family protein [Fimbriiglobus sp.]